MESFADMTRSMGEPSSQTPRSHGQSSNRPEMKVSEVLEDKPGVEERSGHRTQHRPRPRGGADFSKPDRHHVAGCKYLHFIILRVF